MKLRELIEQLLKGKLEEEVTEISATNNYGHTTRSLNILLDDKITISTSEKVTVVCGRCGNSFKVLARYSPKDYFIVCEDCLEKDCQKKSGKGNEV